MKSRTVLTALLATAALSLTAGAQVADPVKKGLKMTVSVVMKEQEVKGQPGKVAYKLVGSGEAAYPDGTALQFGIHLKDDQNFVIRGQGFVTAGRWEIELPPMGDNIYHGDYVCQVDFDPELQQRGIMTKIPADKRQRNNAKCDQRIGSDELINKDMGEALGWYKEKVRIFRSVFEKVKTAYEAQMTTKNQAAWRPITSGAQDELAALDVEMANWRKKRLNVLRQDLFDALAGALLTFKDYGIDAYTAQLAFDGRPPRDSTVAHNEEIARKAIETLEKATSGAKTPEEPKK
jgi:hypothetical protein